MILNPDWSAAVAFVEGQELQSSAWGYGDAR